MKTHLSSCIRYLILSVILITAGNLYSSTDLEVTYIERTPKYDSYQGRVQYSSRTFTDDFTPYYASYAYGLSGQDSSTKRWPDPGETVTFIAHFRNRGTTTISSFNYTWKFDNATVASGTYSTSLAPGSTGTLSRTWSWEWAEHTLEFIGTASGDGHSSNNNVKIYTNSIGIYTFIDYNFDSSFQAATPGYPNASTDSIIEWLQRHCTKLNQMFIDAGSTFRWRYDRLDLSNNYPASLPSYIVTNYDGAFPQRYYYQTTYGDPRSGSGYYDSSEDIDYGLLHEIGHQFGIIDLYTLNLDPGSNYVNGLGYSAMAGLWNGCSHFVSEHTALAMNHWNGKRRGYFGQYQFCVPTTNKMLFYDTEGQPLSGANVTVYQKINTSTNGDHVPNIPKFTGTTDANGIYTIPNVYLAFKNLFWTAIGDDIYDNPFGYIWCVGHNGLLLFKIEKGGAVDYQWLDILECNIAYWKGNTAQATYVRNTSLGRAMQFAPPTDCAELNAASWASWAQGASAETYDDTSRKIAGAASVRMETNGGFDTYIRYPQGIIAHWDLRNVTNFNISFYTINIHSFQGSSPWIRIGNYNGSYYQFQGTRDILNDSRNVWRSYSIPMTGNATWIRTQVGTPDLSDINFIEIHADTWDYGFTLYVDGVSFTPQPAPLDTDGDDLPDFWEIPCFGNLLQGRNGDPDGDKRTNYAEFLAMTDPMDINSLLAVTSTKEVLDGDNPGVHVTWTTVQSKKYQLYYCDANYSGSMTWLPCGSPMQGTRSAVTFVDNGDGGRVSPLDPSVLKRYYWVCPQ